MKGGSYKKLKDGSLELLDKNTKAKKAKKPVPKKDDQSDKRSK